MPGVPATFLGTNCQMGLGSSITLDPAKHYLCIAWDDVKGALNNSSSATPDSLEDYQAATDLTLADKVLTDTNVNTGQKITADRRFFAGGLTKGVDQGQFEPGTDLAVYSLTKAYYTADQNPSRPAAAAL